MDMIGSSLVGAPLGGRRFDDRIWIFVCCCVSTQLGGALKLDGFLPAATKPWLLTNIGLCWESDWVCISSVKSGTGEKTAFSRYVPQDWVGVPNQNG